MNQKVSVVIINYNSGKYIFKCLEHVRAQTYPDIEVMVVDNASTDGSSARLKEMGSRGEILYRWSDINGGASKANNFGIRNTSGELVLILNADAFLHPNFIARCVAAFSSDPEIGTVIGKLVSSHDSSVIDSTGVMLFREGMPMDRGQREKDIGQYDRPMFMAAACCAAALYSRRMLEAVRFEDEYYDEEFFAYYEDVDLSVRALLLGWKTLYIPDAVAQHVRGASNEKGSRMGLLLSRRNLRLFYFKTFKHGDLLGAVLRKLLYFGWSFAATGDMEREFREDIETGIAKVRESYLKKRRQLLLSADYDRLRPFCRESYLFHRLKSLMGYS